MPSILVAAGKNNWTIFPGINLLQIVAENAPDLISAV